MDIRTLKQTAAQRLETARDAKKIVLIYAGITIVLSALVTVVNYMTSLEISQSGGLSKMNLRSILSTLQNVLPILQSLLLMVVELGYMNAALRISRGQYASPNSLKMGADRFWPLLRCTLMQGLIYGLVGMASFYLAMQIFLFTPLSGTTMEILTPLVSNSTLLSSGTIPLDESLALQLAESMIPLFVLFALLCAGLCIPLLYSFRMANYVLIDKPQAGGMTALRESRNMMKRNRFKLFKLDLSFWWYHLLVLLAAAVCYGDMLLSLAGIQLPWPAEVSYFVFYALFLILTLGIYYLFRNKIEVTYALAYESFRPEETKDNSVVLGNIFEM